MDDEHCNICEREEFIHDLNHVLMCAENMMLGLCYEEDYVKAYEYFVHRWEPK